MYELAKECREKYKESKYILEKALIKEVMGIDETVIKAKSAPTQVTPENLVRIAIIIRMKPEARRGEYAKLHQLNTSN